MQSLRVVCAGSCLIALVSALPAHAEEGEFQLGLGTPVLGYTSITEEPDDGEETTTSGMTEGIGQAVFGELGYGVTPNLVLGGLVQLAGSSLTAETGDVESDTGSFQLLLGPKLDYVISPGDKAQPFVGGIIGYVASSTSFELAGTDVDISESGFLFMARGGVRLFPGKEFSVDPWLGFSYFTGAREYEGGGTSVENDLSGWELMVNVTLSGWM